MSREYVVLSWEPSYCRHCFGCIANCTRGALTVDHERGVLCYDRRKCVRCGNCLKACYTGALHSETVLEP